MAATTRDDDEAEDAEVADDPGRPPKIANTRLYELALVAYTEFPGQHAKVALIVGSQSKYPISDRLMRQWWTKGVKTQGLPPIAEALRAQVRATLGGEPGFGPDGQQPSVSVAPEPSSSSQGPQSSTLNPLSEKTRRHLQRLAVKAQARARVDQTAAEAERERVALERDRAKIVLAQAETERARAEVEVLRAKATAAVVAGKVSGEVVDLVKRRAEDAKIMGALRSQMAFALGLSHKLFQGLAHLAPQIETAIHSEAANMSADASMKLMRRGMSIFKDLGEVLERGMKLDRLILGEPTEIHQVNGPTDQDPLTTITTAVEAFLRSESRGALALTEEQRMMLSSVDTTAVDEDGE